MSSNQRGRGGPAAKQGRRTPRWLWVTAGVAVLAVLAGAGFAVHRWLPTRSQSTSDLVNAGREAMPGKAPEVGSLRAVRLGTVAKDGDFAFKVTRATSAGRTLGTGSKRVTASGKFVVVRLAVKNLGKEPRPLLATVQRLHDSGGATYVADTRAPSPLSKRLWAELGPGRAVAGAMVFDVPRGTKIRNVELHGTGTSAGIRVKL